jgi:FkbM family methyltransferase
VHCEAQLDSILSEGVQAARQRERTAFDSFAGGYADAIVLYGAGNLGRKALHGLCKHGVEPQAFVDRNPGLWGKSVEGVPVFSPEEAARKFGKSAAFVVCVWHPDREHGVQHIIEHLGALGAERVTSFVPLFWKYSQHFLPYFFWELPSRLLAAEGKLRQAFAELDGDSRSVFTSQLRMRTRADFSSSSVPSPPPAYFPADLFKLCTDECLVDCGAFDGDTIRAFVEQSGGAFRRIVAFEPDPQNYRELQKTLAADGRLNGRTTVYNAAVGFSAGTVRFAATGRDNAAVTADGAVEVECRTLDETVAEERPTFIKMDIEGSEHAALTGGCQTIHRDQPVLAVSVYHQPHDLWDLPLFMRELEPDSRLSLRMYWRDGFDLVCFAVPPARRESMMP